MLFTEKELDRVRVEAVFRLGGGELNEEPWNGYAYNYDGIPGYAGDDLDQYGPFDFMTVINFALFSKPKAIPGWERAASFYSSGETECTWCGNSCGEERVATRPDCQLCGGDGYIYIGDCTEVVFRRPDLDSRLQEAYDAGYALGAVAQPLEVPEYPGDEDETDLKDSFRDGHGDGAGDLAHHGGV